MIPKEREKAFFGFGTSERTERPERDLHYFQVVGLTSTQLRATMFLATTNKKKIFSAKRIICELYCTSTSRAFNYKGIIFFTKKLYFIFKPLDLGKKLLQRYAVGLVYLTVSCRLYLEYLLFRINIEIFCLSDLKLKGAFIFLSKAYLKLYKQWLCNKVGFGVKQVAYTENYFLSTTIQN